VPSSDAFWKAAKAAVESALPEFLLKQRWYPAKGQGGPTVRDREFFPMAGPAQSAVAAWEVSPQGGDPLLMFVPVVVVQSDAANPDQTITTLRHNGTSYAILEAFSDDDFVRSWIGDSETPQLHRGRTNHPLQIDPATAQIRRSSVEQSNTSIRIGDQAIMKVIRKLESGPHPELEIARFLAKTGFTATPALLGWIETIETDGRDSYALSLLQEYVPNDGDGWSWTLNRLNRAITSGDKSALDELTKWLERLAMRTAELHRAFDAGTDDPDFRPEPVTMEDFARWEKSAETMGKRAFHSMETCPALDDEGRQLSAELNKNREAVFTRILDVKNLPRDFVRTRHHGDFHLGQVLVAGDDAVLVDFEGEPLRPLAQRRAKHCVLRDVAGIVRSLSYAAAAVARSLPAAKREHIALDQWQAQAARGFIESYFATAQGLRSIPRDRAEAEALLDFFLLEKALYEVNYEAANRPDWIAIPLQGVLSLLRQERQ